MTPPAAGDRAASTWQIGVDIGGTFTDIAAVSDRGEVSLWKEPTTREQRDVAIMRGLEATAQSLGLELRELLVRCTRLVHGSTVATNALIERDGSRVGLICTEGFRDVLYFRDGYKWDRFNVRLPRPDDFVPRDLRLGVAERIMRDGSIRTPLDEDHVRGVAAQFRARSVEAVAVSLLWSHVNPAHERRVLELLAEELPGIPVLLSCDILPELGEWQRTSATVLSAYIYSPTFRYLATLREWLAANGLERDLLVMQINGGCALTEQVMKVPVSMTVSGPAAAPAAALRATESLGTDDLICIDMGGTSLDVCVVTGGVVPRSREIMVEHQPIGVPGVEIGSVGAGGGSIAWIDSGGAMRVGPASAGSRPGPAAYDRGGAEPTVTDANVALGYLSPTAFLGGRWNLRRDLAEAAIRRRVAEPLGISVTEAAAGILGVVNENMLAAIRTVSVERGIDPRPYTMIAGGGAGPLHAGRLAADLGLSTVLVPAEAGTVSAYGMTVVDVRHEYTGAAFTTSAAPAIGEVAGTLERLREEALADLAASGIAQDVIRIERSVDARYEGQVHELTISLDPGPLDDTAIAACVETFHDVHRQRFGYALDATAVEFLHWRLAGIGVMERPAAPMVPVPVAKADRRSVRDLDLAAGVRDAYFSELGGFVSTPVYDASALPAGAWMEGPALIDSATTTVVVYPNQVALSDGRGGFLIELPGVPADRPSATAAGEVAR